MHQEEINSSVLAANLAVELIKAQEFYLANNAPPNYMLDKITLFRDDVKDIYQMFFYYQQQILDLQKLFEREIKSTGKTYGIKSGGVLDKQALLDAINIIRQGSQSWKK